jgi:class 3 adenylate cyclase
MQFVEGANLREQITESGMEFNTVADIMTQVCRTLANAHEQGVIHRDLKPENIMVRQNASGDLIVKVIDFGIAKVKNSVIAPSTQTGLVAGTERYMSPEHLLGKKVDHTSDIYALGIIAYEMLTGRVPFNPETRYQLHELQREGVKAMPADLRPGLSKAAQNVLLRALSYEPSDRYQSARTFAHELAQALINETESEENSSQMQNDRIKVAHVLFLDIVGYSKLPTDHQSTVLSQLQEIVRVTVEFSRAKDKKELILIPTGDGMALVFFGNPDAPVLCALEISKALKSHPEIQLRMGIHSGPVNQILDVNGNVNVAGAGINMAQRVMDCGDAGHILLSKRIADDLGQYSSWQQNLHDLGETEVKHGVSMHIVNLYKDDLGNPELPEKFKRRKYPSFLMSAVAAVLALVIIGGVLIIWAPWGRKVADSTSSTPAPVSPSIITYSLTVQKGSRDSKTNEFMPLGDPIQSTGQEIFGNDWEFSVNITPAQSGSLYLVNEGPGVGGATVYNVLFPTKENNNYVAQIAANQTMRAKAYFDEHPGTEKLWIIWTTDSLDKLDKIFEDAGNNNTAENMLVISDPAQIKTVRDLLAIYDSSKPDVVPDKTKKETTIKGSGAVLISLLELRHEK